MKRGKLFRNYAIVCMLSIFVMVHCTAQKKGLPYQTPGSQPELFAPSVVNTEAIEINAVYNSTYTELFFTRIIDKRYIIHHSEWKEGAWTTPEPIQMYADQTSESVAIDPSITQDGKTLYFLGIGPEDRAKRGKPDIYRSEKVDGKWQIATKVGAPISTQEYAESYPVVVADGSLYFTSDRPGSMGARDIYRAHYLGDGKFDTPVNLGSPINSEKNERSTYVSPDEQVLITGNTYTDQNGFAVSFKENGTWQAPVYFDIGEAIAEDWIYYCPYMSPDGNSFFFSKRYSDPPGSGWAGVTKGEVYWLDARDLYKLKEK